MSVSFPIVEGAGPVGRPSAPDPKPRNAPEASFAESIGAANGAATQPPPEVRAEVRAAARCADELHRMGRQLRFEVDDKSGRIRVEVRDLEGNVLRRVPPTEIFDFAAGKVTS